MRILILCLVLIGLSSCGEEEKVNIRLTMAERERVDETVRETMDSLRPLLQTNCKNTFEDRVNVATDSIVQRLLEEEARLRARIANGTEQ